MKNSHSKKIGFLIGAAACVALVGHAANARADVATYRPTAPSAASAAYTPYSPYPQQASVPTSASQPASASSVYYAPSQVPVQPASPAPMPTAQAGVNFAAEPVVDGFADQVPLTVALQQILPQGYGYTLGDGVNPGQLVSWRGGRPWNAILQDMLGASGLSYSANSNLITVNATGASPTVVAGNNLPPVPPAPVAPAPVMQAPVATAPPQVIYQQPEVVAPAPVVPAAPAPEQVMQQPAPQPEQVAPAPQADAQAPQQLMQPQPLQIENPAVFVPQVWEVRPGRSLREQLQDWCSRVGVELHWDAEYDYPIQASMSMTGTFEEAVRVLLTGFGDAKPTPRARLHYNPAAGQSILIIEATGNNYGE